ncbi:MAG: hypothetical protein P0Y53_17445 [Candidatus Pseudobacter hemicellulosilyticus]|uniref:Uncharacterized protein n=1 Tax=Candidatus Pseudobacter hemicellulosilyticus TaxID=3121375 RepID=A0AAJ5WQL6_9BACT|nr:MAG: hypothetical protein P0Y53_17445 [Pseudobacter sp.]
MQLCGGLFDHVVYAGYTGNTLATYKAVGQTLSLEEQFIYGSSRIGVIRSNLPASLTITGSTVPGIDYVFQDTLTAQDY